MDLFKTLAIETPFTEDQYRALSREEAFDRILDAANESFSRRSERIMEVAKPVIVDCVENRNMDGRIAVPMTDGKRFFNLVINLKEAYDTECRSIVKEWHKAVLLLTIDELWKEHLRELDQLRQSVQNASYEQKDPLVIYKVESFHIFEEMLNRLNSKAMSTLLRGQIYIPQQQQQESRSPEIRRAMPEAKRDYSQDSTNKDATPEAAAQRAAASAHQGQPAQRVPTKAAPKVGRNDPCPCGSGKKFKNCHGKDL